MDILKIIHSILEHAEEEWYSDIHINTMYLPTIRNKSWDITELHGLEIDGENIEFQALSEKQVLSIIEYVIGKDWLEEYLQVWEIDWSYTHSEISRYRINCYKDSKWHSVAMRAIPHEIPTLKSLWLWEQIEAMCNKSKWLILVTWPTGSGKSTNIAAMIDYINSNTKKHIITIEDPIEFVFTNKKSLINQREVGLHTKSFPSAIRSSLREDPDVIMLGEMRDPETIKAAITLAETWHIVLSTLHTNDTVQSIDRIIDVFPPGQQEQVRMQLAMSLIWIVAQRLVPKKDIEARIAAREILISNDAVRSLIISWKTHQLYSVIEIGRKQWMILMDSYLIALYKKGIISKEILLNFVRDKENIELLK